MDRLEAIKIFVRVVESGSFSAVARELGTGQPAISKQVAALEEHLGAQLLMRTSRSLSLTEAGRDFYESSVRLISDLEATESRIGSGQASPSGVVRVTAAHAFSRLFVVPKLPLFRERYPKVVVEMLVSERTSNLEPIPLPMIIGNDGAVLLDDGTPVVIYPVMGTESWKGDETIDAHWHIFSELVPGTMADYAAVPKRNAVPIPEGLSALAASLLGTAWPTAHRALFTKSRPPPYPEPEKSESKNDDSGR
jgi:hypothetical protein